MFEGLNVGRFEGHPPPHLFSELCILKDLQEGDFATAHFKGVRERNVGTAHSKGLSEHTPLMGVLRVARRGRIVGRHRQKESCLILVGYYHVAKRWLQILEIYAPLNHSRRRSTQPGHL